MACPRWWTYNDGETPLNLAFAKGGLRDAFTMFTEHFFWAKKVSKSKPHGRGTSQCTCKGFCSLDPVVHFDPKATLRWSKAFLSAKHSALDFLDSSRSICIYLPKDRPFDLQLSVRVTSHPSSHVVFRHGHLR